MRTFHSEMWSVLGAKTSRDLLLIWRQAAVGVPPGDRSTKGSLQRMVPGGRVWSTRR